jgi:hypothetical protein
VTVYQLRCQYRQSFGVVVSWPIFDRHILTLEIASFVQALAECRQEVGTALKHTGIANCCARASHGQAIAAPPRTAMKSRRLISPSPKGDSLSHRVLAVVHHSKGARSMSALGQKQTLRGVRPMSLYLQ